MDIIKAKDFITEVEGYSLKEIGDYLFGAGEHSPPGSYVLDCQNDILDQNDVLVFPDSSAITFSTTSPKFGTYYLGGGGIDKLRVYYNRITDGDDYPAIWCGGKTSFTFSCWAKDVTFATDSGTLSLFKAVCNSVDGSGDNLVLLRRIDGTYKMQIKIDNSFEYLTLTKTPSSGWHHYGIAYDSANEKMYWIVDDEYDELDLSGYDWPSCAANQYDIQTGSVEICVDINEGAYDTDGIQDILWNPTKYLGVDMIIAHYEADSPWS